MIMKVYNFSGSAGTRHRNIEHNIAVQGQRRFLRRARGGGDMVDISAEAMKKYREHNTVELEAARIKKLTARVLDIIHRSIDNPETRDNGVIAAESVHAITASGNAGSDESVRLRETAENILGFFIS